MEHNLWAWHTLTLQLAVSGRRCHHSLYHCQCHPSSRCASDHVARVATWSVFIRLTFIHIETGRNSIELYINDDNNNNHYYAVDASHHHHPTISQQITTTSTSRRQPPPPGRCRHQPCPSPYHQPTDDNGYYAVDNNVINDPPLSPPTMMITWH